MKRILLVVIPSGVVAKTLAGSGALSELGRRHELHFLAASDVTASLPGPVTHLEPEYQSSKNLQRLDFFFWYVELIHFLRIRGENLRENFKFQRLGKFWQAIYGTLARPGIIQATRLLDGLIFKGDRQMEALLKEVRPELVIMPGSALDSYSFIVGRTAKALGLPTLFVITHWDHFSKKSLFRFIPDRAYLWGEDMLDSATRHGGYPRSMFSIVGAPQFQKYLSGLPTREEAASRLGLDPAKKWLLYAAPSVPFDDVSVADAVNRFIEERHPGTVGLIFRPHPRAHKRKSRVSVRIEDLPHVTLDAPDRTGLDQDQHYLDLLALCSGLISPWSTMVLEFGLVGHPSLCVSFPDGINDWDWANAERSEHVDALLSRKSVVNCRQESELRDKLQELIALSEDRHRTEQIRRSMGLAVHSDDSTYAERLLRQVERDYLAPAQAYT